MPARASGGCLCGAIGYRVDGPLRDVVFCHCNRCRRTHGHFAAYTACARGDLELVESRGLRWFVRDGRRRGFCAECGASVFWEREGSPTISISAGTLDEPTGLNPGRHVFTADAGDYYEIGQTTPRVETGQGAERGLSSAAAGSPRDAAEDASEERGQKSSK